MYNDRDGRVPWVARMSQILNRYEQLAPRPKAGPRWRQAFATTDLFGPFVQLWFDHTQVLYGSGIGNTALNSGAIHNSGGTLTFSNSILSQAFYDGLDTVGGNVSISNSVFTGADRAVVSTFGGSTMTIVNSTFDDNRIGVFAHAGGSFSMKNSIVSNSLEIGVDTDSGPQAISYSDVYTTVASSVNYSGMTDPTGTNGNISAAPLYYNRGLGGDYRIYPGSPTIGGFA